MATTPAQDIRESDTRTWGRDLCHPLPMAAVWLLALNDHWLKGSGVLPGALTGKLSDVVGLFFFPLLLVAVVQGAHEVVARRPLGPRRALIVAAAAATAGFFTLVKLWGPVNEWVEGWWGVMVMDATDLWALPMVVAAVVWMWRR